MRHEGRTCGKRPKDTGVVWAIGTTRFARQEGRTRGKWAQTTPAVSFGTHMRSFFCFCNSEHAYDACSELQRHG